MTGERPVEQAAERTIRIRPAEEADDRGHHRHLQPRGRALPQATFDLVPRSPHEPSDWLANRSGAFSVMVAESNPGRRGGRLRLRLPVQGAGGLPHHGGGLGVRPPRPPRAGHRQSAPPRPARRRRGQRVPRRHGPHRGRVDGMPERCTRRAASASSESSGRWAGSSTAGSTPPSCSASCGSGPAEGNRQGAGVDGAGSIQRSCQTIAALGGQVDLGVDEWRAAGRPFSET